MNDTNDVLVDIDPLTHCVNNEVKLRRAVCQTGVAAISLNIEQSRCPSIAPQCFRLGNAMPTGQDAPAWRNSQLDAAHGFPGRT